MAGFTLFSERLAKLTPLSQRFVMNSALIEHSDAVGEMNKVVAEIPGLGETDGLDGKHPLSLHYFAGGSDWYITEWDRGDMFFGYVILNDDLQMSEWGYIDRHQLMSIEGILRRQGRGAVFNLDFHCPYKTVEEALFNRNPDYFKKYAPATEEGAA